ncbi:MAG TPA: CHAT domain-containing tetratricopeptide repeat protein [Blastocatellia bacterium]|nr:CHAT domain-containing tetratricopeptide repeat protein [Blastocatellia bacterium]
MGARIIFLFAFFSNPLSVYPESFIQVPAPSRTVNQSASQVTQESIRERNQKAQDLRRNGKYSQALELARETLSMVYQYGIQNKESETLFIIGTIHRVMGDYQEALESFRKSLNVAESRNDKTYIAVNQNGIGNVYLLRGDYAKALRLYEMVKDEAEREYRRKSADRGNEEAALATVWGNIGEVYKKLGNDAVALEAYDYSLSFQGNRPAQARALNDMGEIHQSHAEYAKAEELFHKSLDLSEKEGLEAQKVSALNSLGNLYLEQEKYAEALEYHKRTLQFAEKLGHREKLVIALYSLANTFFRMGHYDSALTYAAQSANIASTITLLEYVWRAQTLEGKVRRILKQSERAAQNFRDAIDIIEQLRNQAVIDQQIKQRFFENKVTPYYEMVDLLVEQNKVSEALLYAERAKGRVLYETFQFGKLDVSKSLTPEERNKERLLEAETIFLNTQISKLSKDVDNATFDRLQAELKKARNEYESWRTALYAKHPELQIQRGEPRPVNLNQTLLALLNPRTALLEFVVLEDKTYLFVINKDDTNHQLPLIQKVYKIAATRDQLRDKVRQFRQQIENKSFTVSKLASQLYDLLLSPARNQLKDKRCLIVVADSVLWDLPFQALQSSPDRYLIEDYAVSYAQSATLLQEIINGKSKRGKIRTAKLLAVGNPALGEKNTKSFTSFFSPEPLAPLPQAEQQVRQLATLYDKRHSKIYTGIEAHEEAIKADAGKYEILHFAAHGILNGTSPMYSHIVLSQVGNPLTEDGLLEAWEVAKLDLNADLVVLSACETARGRIGAGEGVIGLSWAFFVAGSPTTVVSQWKVLSASTTRLMVEFYRNLQSKPVALKNKGTREANSHLLPAKAEALRRAALKMLKSSAYREPLYWAPFIIVGDPN